MSRGQKYFLGEGIAYLGEVFQCLWLIQLGLRVKDGALNEQPRTHF
jgi:hypothetical protein